MCMQTTRMDLLLLPCATSWYRGILGVDSTDITYRGSNGTVSTNQLHFAKQTNRTGFYSANLFFKKSCGIAFLKLIHKRSVSNFLMKEYPIFSWNYKRE